MLILILIVYVFLASDFAELCNEKIPEQSKNLHNSPRGTPAGNRSSYQRRKPMTLFSCSFVTQRGLIREGHQAFADGGTHRKIPEYFDFAPPFGVARAPRRALAGQGSGSIRGERFLR